MSAKYAFFLKNEHRYVPQSDLLFRNYLWKILYYVDDRIPAIIITDSLS